MLDKFVFRKNTSDENVIKEILEKKAYSKKKIDFKIEPDDVWLDGGSHIGVFGLYAAQNGAKKVYCYEPETENYKILQENIRHIGTEYSTNLESFQYAINQTGGTHSFTIAPNTWRHSLVTHYKKKLPTIEINCMSFDEILERHRDINCIKLDIEGSGNLILKEGFISQGIEIMSSGRDTITGPGLPVLAILNALETISGILFTLFISVIHFAIPEYISL